MSLMLDKHLHTRFIIPQDLCKNVGKIERVKLLRVGLLSSKVVSLEREIADLVSKTQESKKRIAELPSEIKDLEKLLEDFTKDQKTLDTLLNKRR
jgi:predicted  nucleic acid-binding Zn-ribbon protein